MMIRYFHLKLENGETQGQRVGGDNEELEKVVQNKPRLLT